MDNLKNLVYTELTETPYTTGDTSITVSDGSVFDDPATVGEYEITVYNKRKNPGQALNEGEAEIMLLTAVSTNTLTVTRAQGGTSAIALGNTIDWAVVQGATKRVFQQIEDRLTYATPEQYGYTGSDKTADTAAFQDMLANESNIYLSGTYVLNSVSGTRDYYNIIGNGEATLDFSNVTDATNSADADLLLEGSYSQIADLDTDANRGDTQLSFGAAHGLSVGDIFFINNPTDSSWSPHRTYYRQGEICKVKNVVDTTTVDLHQELYDDYTAANVDVYKMSPVEVNLEGFKIIGNDRFGLRVNYAKNPRIKNLEFSGVFQHTVRLAESIGGIISGVTIDHTDSATLYNYGVLYGSCQNLIIKDCDLYTRGDSVEAGRGEDFDFPSRGIIVDNVFGSSNISQHGLSEFTKVTDCFSFGNIVVGGNNAEVKDCTTYKTIRLSREPVGCNFSAINNTVHNLGGVADPLSAQQCSDAQFNSYGDQLLEIRGNRVYDGAIDIGNAAAVTYGMRCKVNDNYVQTTISGSYYPDNAIDFDDLCFDSFEMKGNTFFGLPDLVFTNAKSGASVDIDGNKWIRSKNAGLIRGNNDCTLTYRANSVYNNERASSGNSAQNTNVFFDQIDQLYIEENKLGDTVSGGNSEGWIGISDAVNIYMRDNSNLKQDNKTIVFGAGASAANLKPYPSYNVVKDWDADFEDANITVTQTNQASYTRADGVVTASFDITIATNTATGLARFVLPVDGVITRAGTVLVQIDGGNQELLFMNAYGPNDDQLLVRQIGVAVGTLNYDSSIFDVGNRIRGTIIYNEK